MDAVTLKPLHQLTATEIVAAVGSGRTTCESVARACLECSAAARCRRELGDVCRDYDVLLTAPAIGEAPVGLNSTGNASLCVIWTTTLAPPLLLREA